MSLVTFAEDMNLSEATKAMTFENYLYPRIKSMVTIKRLRTLRDIVDDTRVTDRENNEAIKHRESEA